MTILKYTGIAVLGMVGMGLFQTGGCLVKDLAYLHAARMHSESPRPAQPPSGKTPGP